LTSQGLIQGFIYYNPDIYPPVINSLRLLAQAGYRIELFCREGADWEVSYPEAVTIHRIESTGSNSWQSYIRFILHALRYGSGAASIFVGHDMHGLLPAKLLASYHKRPLVYHCHDFAEEERLLPSGSKVVRTFERRYARTADIVIAPDADRSKVMVKQLHLQHQPVIVANAPLKRPLIKSEVLQQAITAKGRHFDEIVFRQGRIGVGHAIEATLHSIPFWKDRRWGFAIMGLGDASYIDKLILGARALGVEDQFVVLPPVSYDQVSAFTPAADLGHALYEPIHINNVHITTASNKIMEYMEAGLPLLVSDTPSLRAHIQQYKCGIVADEQSPGSIAAAINTLLGDPQRVAVMGAAARRAFEEVFCYERQFAGMLDAFQRLI
jgi:glycosyltransferase involved in cell wall biosynthesis